MLTTDFEEDLGAISSQVSQNKSPAHGHYVLPFLQVICVVLSKLHIMHSNAVDLCIVILCKLHELNVSCQNL